MDQRPRFAHELFEAVHHVAHLAAEILHRLAAPSGHRGVESRPVIDGRVLTFQAAGREFRGRETGSTWNLLGQAVKGPLAGRRLTAIPHVDAFWFAWAAFNPTTSLYTEP